jgi:hypothetical protein
LPWACGSCLSAYPMPRSPDDPISWYPPPPIPQLGFQRVYKAPSQPIPSRSRPMSALGALRALPTPPRVIPDWRRFQEGHPKSSQPGPVHARFSRGWAEIGVDFSDQASFGVGFTRLATLCPYPQRTDPLPYPLCRPNLTQGHPTHPRISRGSKPSLVASS